MPPRKHPLGRGAGLPRTSWQRKQPCAGTTRAPRTRKAPAKRPDGYVTEAYGRKTVYGRSDGWCEVQIPGVCLGRAESWHHRKDRSLGGTWQPSGGLHTCGDGTRGCHGWITENPAAARADGGWALESHEDPLAVPVLIASWMWPGERRWVLLDDEGNFTPALDLEETMEDLVLDEGGDLVEDATATFNASRSHRYVLTRIWNPDVAPLVVVGLNPSTADAFQLDPTITRLRKRAQQRGDGGLVMLNLFGLRSTDPRELKRHPDPVGLSNDQLILEHTADAALVLAAWGAHEQHLVRRHRGRGDQIAEMLLGAGRQLHCLGTTTAGHPRHPLYVPTAAELVAWPGRVAS